MSFPSFQSFSPDNVLPCGNTVGVAEANEVESVVRSAHPVRPDPLICFPLQAGHQNIAFDWPDLTSPLCTIPYRPPSSLIHSLPSLYGVMPTGIDTSTLQAFLAILNSKDPSSIWGQMQLYPYGYDQALASLLCNQRYDLNRAKRKNMSRDAAATLKLWLSEHKSNPYPTKTEKTTLAISSRMSLAQVSTWFANARRRLKQKHCATWLPYKPSFHNSYHEDAEQEPVAENGETSDVSLRGRYDNASQYKEYLYDHSQSLLRRFKVFAPYLRNPESIRNHREEMQRSDISSPKDFNLFCRKLLGDHMSRSSERADIQNIYLHPRNLSLRKDNVIHCSNDDASSALSTYESLSSPPRSPPVSLPAASGIHNHYDA